MHAIANGGSQNTLEPLFCLIPPQGAMMLSPLFEKSNQQSPHTPLRGGPNEEKTQETKERA